MKKFTITECKKIVRERGDKLPRVGYETYITTRQYESFCKVYKYTADGDGYLDVQKSGTRLITEKIYLQNIAGRLSIRYYYPVNENM